MVYGSGYIAKSIVEIKDPDNQHRYIVAEPWAPSMFKRMKFTQRAVTQEKFTMPECLISEAKLSFTGEIS